MKFIEVIQDLFFNLGDFIGSAIETLLNFLTQPLALLLSFFEGIFYFITQLFTVVIIIVKIFVAFFQFFFSIGSSLINTVTSWVGFVPSGSVSLPSASRHGFEAVLDQVGGTGLLTVIPNVLIAFIWLGFAYKIIGLMGDKKGGSIEK